MSEKKTLGILGGMGPMATVYFYRLITEHTLATCDAEHLNILITIRTDIPDRTNYIMGRINVSPAPLCADMRELWGRHNCRSNTAHFFRR